MSWMSCMSCAVSSFGIMTVTAGSTGSSRCSTYTPAPSFHLPWIFVHSLPSPFLPPNFMSPSPSSCSENPMDTLNRSYRITAILAVTGFLVCVRVLLYVEDRPDAWLHFAACGVVGIVNGYIFIQSTQVKGRAKRVQSKKRKRGRGCC